MCRCSTRPATNRWSWLTDPGRLADPDAFGTAALRDAVLAAWSANPDRFREDANAEEDLALGPYGDRVVVELAQNAADAATRAGLPGRLLLRLCGPGNEGAPSMVPGPRLLVANTGAPVDAAGVRGLASLRASAKREGAGVAGRPDVVGRFGVGSTAVAAVADDVTWWTASGDGVRFSRALTTEALARRGDGRPGGEALAVEVAARAGGAPLLRLPWAVAAQGRPARPVPRGYETAVVVELRDDAALAGVRAQLADVGDALLLALPALAEVVVEDGGAHRRIADPQARWHVVRRSGAYEAASLEGLGVEERARARVAGWSVAWALPRAHARGEGGPADDTPSWPRVLHAPTPTAEPLDWPALLVASLPVEASRRAVVEGPASARVVEEAGRAYADLLAERAAAGDDVLHLVPVGLGVGPLDVALREAAVAALGTAPVLLPTSGPPLRPSQAVVLDDAGATRLGDDPVVLAALAPVVAGLVAAPAHAAAALRALGVARTSLAEVAEALPTDPGAWAAVVGGLAGVAARDGAVREQLGALAVPLADGRVARGARGLLLPVDVDVTAAAGRDAARALAVLAAHGVALVAVPGPGTATTSCGTAAADLLLALGAVPASARAVLAAPATAAAIRAAAEEDPSTSSPVSALAEAVLTLAAAAVAAGELRPGDLPVLAALDLPDQDGEVLPAAGLVLPGGTAQVLLDPDEVGVVDGDVLARWGPDVLEAVGVARTLAVARYEDVDPLDPPEGLAALDGALDWLDGAAESAGPGSVAPSVQVVRDLDLVRRGAQAELLAALAADRSLRAAVVDGVRWVAPTGASTLTPSPAAAWIGDTLALRGRPARSAGEVLRRLLPAVPEPLRQVVAALDDELAAALGLVAAWEDLDGSGWSRLLTAVSAGERPLPSTADVLALGAALAAAALAGRAGTADVEPPAAVLALDAAGRVVVAEAGQGAVVADDPVWAQRTDLGARVVVPAEAAGAVADVLAIDLSSERAPGRVAGAGRVVAVPGVVLAAMPQAPPTWHEHDGLTVDGQSVAWWVRGHGPSARVDAATASGLARGLAWAAGEWERRHLVEALLADGDHTAALVEDAAG